MEYPKVSIIIPFYNASNYIERCVESVIKQDYKNIEIILVDDGSVDDSYKICNSFTKENILLFHQKNNGVSSARNKGVSVSSGEFIAFVDADDYLPCNSISTLVDYAIKYNASLVCSSFSYERRNGYEEYLYKNKLIKKDEPVHLIQSIKSISIAPWAKLFKSKIIKDNNVLFPKDMHYGEDFVFIYEYLKYVDTLYICSNVLYYYNTTSPTSTENNYYKDYYKYNSKKMDTELDCYKYLGVNINTIERQNIVDTYFEKAIKYYFYHINSIESLNSMIELSANILYKDNCNGKYYKYIKQKKWNKILKLWKKNNFIPSCISKIEKIINH